MSNFMNYIASRRTEIKEELAKLRAELKELDAAESAVVANKTRETPALVKSRGDAAAPTIKECVLAVLADQPAGADSMGILKMIKQRFNIDVKRPSLSPQLTRLKSDGKVTLTGTIWNLPSNVEAVVDE